MTPFEEKLHENLHAYLMEKGECDERLPDCPDVEEKWEQIATAYIPDGVREFNSYPEASLGWMMYIGMAVAKFWDGEWEIYSKLENIYSYLKEKRGYDCLDEYVREEVLMLTGDDYAALEKLTGSCATQVNSFLRHQDIEPSTKEAFNAYVDCLHQLYVMGAAVQLKRMGYHMVKS